MYHKYFDIVCAEVPFVVYRRLLLLLLTEESAGNFDPLHPAMTAVAQWLRCCATNRKVPGSIPDGVIGISH